MADTDSQLSSDTAPSRNRLPSPGCLFALTLLAIMASVSVWVGWRVHRREAQQEYFEQLGAFVVTEPAKPVWLYEFVADNLGEEHAVGFSDITLIGLVTDAGLEHLSGLTNLETLSLEYTQVTDADLQYLSGLTNLMELYLNHTQVSDVGLQHLSGLNNLHELSLHNTQITDDGLQHLQSLANLERLYLSSTLVTDAGVNQLQLQLPGVEIVR